MKICVYGAGAIGGLMAAKLAASGAEVSVVARGATLSAIKDQGLSLEIEGETIVTHPQASDDPGKLGPQDSIILGVKAPALRQIADRIEPLLGPETTLVSAINGIPWWYCYKLEGSLRDRALSTVDPDGLLWKKLDPARTIGCVVFPAAHIAKPGHIVHEHGNRFMLGEPDGAKSKRVSALSEAMTKAGFKAPVRTKIRDDIWLKLWGNLSFNPISALTGGTMEEIANDPGTLDVARRMMAEAEKVARALGVDFSVDIETRIGWARDVGAHRTSMLQDLESGRTMEIDALVAAVAELGDLVEIDTPAIDLVLGLVMQRARLAGCYP